MKSLVFLSLLLACSIADSQSESSEYIIPENSKVQNMTQSDYLERVYDYKEGMIIDGPWFLMMYAPWCHICKKFQPIYEDFALANYDKANFGRIDCTNKELNNDVCESFDVEGYPTILFLHNNQTYEYKGGRDMDKMHQFFNLRGYETVTPTEIPEIRKLEWQERWERGFNRFFRDLGTAIEHIFSFFGLENVPKKL